MGCRQRAAIAQRTPAGKPLSPEPAIAGRRGGGEAQTARSTVRRSRPASAAANAAGRCVVDAAAITDAARNSEKKGLRDAKACSTGGSGCNAVGEDVRPSATSALERPYGWPAQSRQRGALFGRTVLPASSARRYSAKHIGECAREVRFETIAWTRWGFTKRTLKCCAEVENARRAYSRARLCAMRALAPFRVARSSVRWSRQSDFGGLEHSSPCT